jgi:hypothetical protein
VQFLVRFKPALRPGGAKHEKESVEVKTYNTAPLCTGVSGDGLRVIGGFARHAFVEHDLTNDCSQVANTFTAPLTFTIPWVVQRHTTKLNPSTVTITSATHGTAADGHPEYTVSGSVTGGSFLGHAVTAQTEEQFSNSELNTMCASKTGIRALGLGASSPPPSTFTMS